MKYISEIIHTILNKDPAAHSYLEVYFTYSGVKALKAHQKAHKLYLKGRYFWARVISERAKRRTGIDIHPGATIGRRVFIDHGVGVVIGETAVVGDDVVIYQGVTLGGTGKEKGKRHPTIEDRVMLAAGAKVLGPFTVGHDSKIGAGSVVLKEVPPYCTVVGIPGQIVKMKDQKLPQMDQIHIPDPIKEELNRLENKIDNLKDNLKD